MTNPLIHELQLHEYLRQRLVDEFPEADDETLADTLEGLTDLQEKIAVVVRSQHEDHLLSKALRARIAEMRDRLGRLEKGVEKKRSLVVTVMERAEIKKIAEPDFTASLRQSPRPLLISDEGTIPDEFWKPQPSKLDRQKLMDDLKNGRHIPGAALGNGGQCLSVRVK